MKTTTKRPLLLLLALLSVFSLIAAACGDDDTAGDTTGDEGTSATTGDEGTTATTGDETADTTGDETTGDETTGDAMMGDATGTVVKIGLLYSENGRTASAYYTSDDVASAWATWVNAHGGVNGHVVEIVARDVESDVAIALERATELVEQEGVIGVIIQDSNTETAAGPYLADKGIPVIGGTSNAFDAEERAEHPVPDGFDSPGSFVLPLAASQAAGKTHFSGIACSEVPTCAAADPIYAAQAPNFGLAYTPLAIASHSEPDYTAFCLAATGDGADVVSLGFAPAVIVPIAQQCQAQGYTGAFSLSANTIDTQALEGQGLELVGYLNGFPWWADAPEAQQFRDAMDAGSPDTDYYRNPTSTITWATLELFRVALMNGPAADADVTAADVVAAYQQVSGETLGGLLPMAFTFGTDGPQPDVPCGWLVSFDGTDWTTNTLGDSGNGATGDLQSYCVAG